MLYFLELCNSSLMTSIIEIILNISIYYDFYIFYHIKT